MTTPVIGVTGSRRGGRLMWYFNWLSLRVFGVKPIRLTPEKEDIDFSRFDGLLIGGGDHISADIYGGVLAPEVRIDRKRDTLELKALEHAADRNIPILGVCRGAQMLNVFFGGSLHVDLHVIYKDAPRVWTPLPSKRVEVFPNSRLYDILNCEFLNVNSLHTQSIDRLASDFQISAQDSFGIVQAIEDPNAKFRIGVQWHPEFLIYRTPHRRLFNAFVEAVKDRNKSYSDHPNSDSRGKNISGSLAH